MTEPLDDLYFTWLYSQVSSVAAKNPSRTYWALLRQLYTKEFVWIVPNDDNRVEDGRDLRLEFLETHDHSMATTTWLELGCSVLEMLIGLSKRLSFEADGEPKIWFWMMINNLGLGSFSDASKILPEEIDEVLETLIWRTYRKDGLGGLFPLSEASEDQTKVEIWYQMSEYLLERD